MLGWSTDVLGQWKEGESRWPSVLLLLAIALAATTRLAGIHLAEFKLDEVWALQMASDIRNGRALPPTGIGSSLGIPNPPFFVYLLVIPLLVSPAPEVATAFIGALNVGAVFATARLTRSLFGVRPAVVAALVFAVAPWAVFFSRKIWAQEAMPIFLVLAITCLWFAVRGQATSLDLPPPLTGQAIERERPVLLIPSVVLFALATQLHLTAIALAPLWVFALVMPGQRRRRVLFGAIGVGVAVLLYAPYLLWQADQGWPTLNRPSPNFGGAWSWEALYLARETVTGQPYLAMASLGDYAWLADGWHRVLRRLLTLALIVGVLRLIVAVFRDPSRRWPALFVLGWLILPVAAFLRPSVPVHTHYFITCLPAAMMTIALGVSPPRGKLLPSRLSATLRFGSVAVVALIVLGGSALFAAFIAALGSGRATADYGPPLHSRRQAITLAWESRAGTAEPIYIAGNYETTEVYRYLLASEGLVASFVDDQRLLVVPKQGTALYLVTDDATPTASLLFERFGAVTVATLRPTTGEQMLRLVRIPNNALQQVLDRAEVQRREHLFANGMALIASEVDTENAAAPSAAPTEPTSEPSKRLLPLTLYWQVQGEPRGPGPQVFNHLVDPDGGQVAQADGPSFDPTDWPEDVVILTPFAIELPPVASGPARVRTGLYYLDTLKRIPLVAGGEWVESRSIDLGPRRG